MIIDYLSSFFRHSLDVLTCVKVHAVCYCRKLITLCVCNIKCNVNKILRVKHTTAWVIALFNILTQDMFNGKLSPVINVQISNIKKNFPLTLHKYEKFPCDERMYEKFTV